MAILVIAEHDNKNLNASTLTTITAALELQQPIHIMVMGYQCEAVATEAATIANVTSVLCADNEVYQFQLAENTAALVAELAKDYHAILAPATTFGKNLLPRIAALLNVAAISDVIKIIDKDTFIRPIYAGNALATIKSLDAIKLLTVRTTAFNAANLTSNVVPITKITTKISNTLSQFVSKEQHQQSKQELTTAKIVVSGGRGLQNQTNFKLVEQLADLLGAAVGASRAAVDAGFVANDYQVGQTGKIVAPDLYIAVGISGAIQHIAGMKDSKVIVAINKDGDAPIFQIADYGLVADFMVIYPELLAALTAAKHLTNN